jgi:alpha-1,6-mannosyltransferase
VSRGRWSIVGKLQRDRNVVAGRSQLMQPVAAQRRIWPQGVVPLRTGPAGRHLVDVTLLFAPTSGGVRSYLLAKHRWLTQRTRMRHTVLVPGSRDDGLPCDVMKFASPPIPFGRGYRLPLRMRSFRNQLARLTPDLIEVGDPYHLARQSLRVAHERKIPAIAFCHSDIGTLADSLLGRWAGRAARRYLLDLYARFELVLAPSNLVAERLSDIGIHHVRVQALGVDVTTFHPDARDPELRVMLGIARDARLLVFAGRLSPEKHAGDLVTATRLLGDRYHLLLIGCGRFATRAPNVTVLGYQREHRQLARLLASCDAFVHAGDQETFGLVVLEALACGLPVIAARAGALPELVDEQVGATFEPRAPDDLARKVHELFERDRATVRRAARKRAEAHGWDSAFTRLLGHYTRLLARPAALEQRLRNAR